MPFARVLGQGSGSALAHELKFRMLQSGSGTLRQVFSQIADALASGHLSGMQTQRFSRFDRRFSVLGIVFGYSFIAFANQQALPISQAIGLLVDVSIPTGLVVGLLSCKREAYQHAAR